MGSDPVAALDKTATAAPSPVTPGGELPAGVRLGHFQISKKLGAGGMGEVYLATDLALDRPVAVKVLPTGTTTGTARERMIREARAQARVIHSNVAHIYFIGEDTGRLYFAMEYVIGETLAERSAKGPIPAEQALALIHDAVLGLREAQRSGFTHRDVKPSNLMVDPHGVVKVLDFGLAAGAPESAGDGPVAQTTMAGTPLYMAPEQARGEPVDFRADIYALGATLYQLVSGHPPFQAQTAAELRSLHETAVRPSIPRGVVPRIQGTAIDGLIARMMAARPADRFASYDELLRAIELVSTQYTRPAGFVVRMIAAGVDLLAVVIVVAVALSLLRVGDGNVPMGSLALPALALVETLLIRRWGTTLGGAMFELQILDADTARPPSWRAAIRRALILFGPLVALSWFNIATDPLGIPAVHMIGNILWGVIAIAWIVHVLYASLRVPGKRTTWDRMSGTIVRYRR